MIVLRDGDRQAARDRLATERRRLQHARLANQVMHLARHYQTRRGLPMVPAGPTQCPQGCPWCGGRWSA